MKKDSDFLNLYIETTSLPNAKKVGKGVFAKKHILDGAIICEYRGWVATEKDIKENEPDIDRSKGILFVHLFIFIFEYERVIIM